jgi:hypothetical protein
MKITWEASDILVGRYTTVPTENGKLCASRTYKIGYYPQSKEAEESRYCLIAITDGMVGRMHTKERLAETLSDHGHQPVATDHLIDMIKSLHRQNEGVEGIAGM